tara:strand:+ start:2918 stop:3793 length:876 start_codon:yes stop_codon:yes gene_type:complete
MSDLKKHIKLMEARGVLGAENGGLELSIGNETIELGKTPEEVASKLKDIKDLDLDDLYASSSVDFADEYGFENEDDAHELFDKAVALLVPRDESVNEAVGEYTYTLEYNGEGASGYSKHILTITNPEGESKVVADDFTYFEPSEQDMQAELESWFKYGHGVGDEPQESIEEGCDVCSDEPEADEQESHKYEKHHSTNTGSVSVEASAETIDELKVLLRKVGITLPGGEPEVGHDMDHSPCDDSEEPMQIVKVDVDDEKPQVNPYNSGQPDKQVLTNIIRDRLKDYLRNSQS